MAETPVEKLDEILDANNQRPAFWLRINQQQSDISQYQQSLAELDIDVDLMSLTPVKRSHSVCAQGGINSVNDQTRQEGDTEWKHFDDTVYGGDFLQHQPPVKEMCEWGQRIIDLARASMVTRSRDLDAFAFGDPDDVRIFDCGDGLELATIGLLHLQSREGPSQGREGPSAQQQENEEHQQRPI